MAEVQPLGVEELAQMERIIAEPITHGCRYFDDRTVGRLLATIRERDQEIARLNQLVDEETYENASLRADEGRQYTRAQQAEELLAELVERSPWAGFASGGEVLYCRHCEAYCGDGHTPGCPWRRARNLAGGKK